MTDVSRPSTRRRPGARLLGERGASAVEFALVVPVLVFMLLGIIEYSRAYQLQASLADAAREGARVMALANDTTSARAAVRSAVSPLPLTDAQITVSVVNGSTTVSPTTCAGAALTANVKVVVKYRRAFASGFMGGAGVDISGTAVMRCGG